MKYYFEFGVDGYVGTEVDSGDLKTAYKKAESVMDEMDFGQLSDIEFRLVTVYDEDYNELFHYGSGYINKEVEDELGV